VTHKHEHDELELDAQKSPARTPAPDGAAFDPAAPASVAQVLRLQETAGNAAASSLLRDDDGRSPVLDVVRSGSGRGLPEETRAELETDLGHDLTDVRVHTDKKATESAKSLGAVAYTVGRDVVVQGDKYAPHTTEGRGLLAHEVTHVVQQSTGPVEGTDIGGGVALGDPASPMEAEAEGVARAVTKRGRPASGGAGEKAPASGRAGARPGLVAQRQPEGGTAAPPAPAPAAPAAATGAVWEAPDELGPISHRSGARSVLGEMTKEVDAGIASQFTGIAEQSQAMKVAIDNQKAKLPGEGSLTASEVGDLTALTLLYQGYVNNSRQALVTAIRSGLGALSNPPSMDDANEVIGEAMHALFLKPDEDKLKTIKEFQGGVKDIADKAKWVADKSLEIINDLAAAKRIFQIGEKLEKFSGGIEKLMEIQEAGKNLMTLAKEAGGGDSILGGADAVEAGVDLVGLVGKPFMSAVPMFGTFWNDYLVPMTKHCVGQLRKLETMADEINRKHLAQMINWTPTPDGWRPVGATPPDLSPASYGVLTGGRPVFEYLYATYAGSQPSSMPKEVEKIIMSKREVLGWEAGEIELEERTWNPGTWATWLGRSAKDLPGWVASHIRDVWMAFYGGFRQT
jgi:Domain of unknown function (DUF4157)